MRHIIVLCLLALASLVTSNVQADVLRQESFEGCTGVGYSLLSGSFGGTVDDGVMCGHDDGGEGSFPFSFSGNVSGQDGTRFIGLEDPAGAEIPIPNAVVLSSVDIAGVTDLGISFLFAAPNATSGRYDAGEYLQLQYSIDGGSFVTVGSFRGGVGLVGLVEDDNLDGSFTVPVNGLVMQRFSYTLNNRAGQTTVAGSSLVVRVSFSSGPQGEMAFDDIIITGTPSGPTADVTVSALAVSVAEDGTTDTYTVVLESEPTADVDIDIGTSSGQVLLSSSGSQPAAMLTLTFTPGNWSTPQTIEVSAIDDTDVEANPHGDTITHVVSSLDLNYDGFALADIPASVADNDVCGDDFCNPTESTVTCPADCGTDCGDSACNGAETTANCADDCGSSCGDGAVNGSEVCDGNVLVGETCSSSGFDFGTLACASDCLSFDTAACADNVCGDGVLFGSEVCDDGLANSDVIADACRTNCTLAGCGDGVIDSNEACDGAQLGGESCVSFGFTSGILLCGGDCSAYNLIGCELDTPLDGGTDGGTDGDAGAFDSTHPETTTSDDVSSVTDGSSIDDTTEDIGSSDMLSTTSDEPTSGVTTEEVETTVVAMTTDAVTSETETTPVVVTTDIDTSDVNLTTAAVTSEVVSPTDVDTTEDLPTSDDGVSTYVAITSDIDSEESTSSRVDTTNGGPVVINPGGQLDAGFDAGLDGGILDETVRREGCDCRVGARRHPSGASFLGIALVGLALARFRRRRANTNQVHQSN